MKIFLCHLLHIKYYFFLVSFGTSSFSFLVSSFALSLPFIRYFFFLVSFLRGLGIWEEMWTFEYLQLKNWIWVLDMVKILGKDRFIIHLTSLQGQRFLVRGICSSLRDAHIILSQLNMLHHIFFFFFYRNRIILFIIKWAI